MQRFLLEDRLIFLNEDFLQKVDLYASLDRSSFTLLFTALKLIRENRTSFYYNVLFYLIWQLMKRRTATLISIRLLPRPSYPPNRKKKNRRNKMKIRFKVGLIGNLFLNRYDSSGQKNKVSLPPPPSLHKLLFSFTMDSNIFIFS